MSEVPVRCSPPPASGWQPVSAVRSRMGPAQFDSYLKSHLVLTVDDPAAAYPDVNAVWAAFEHKLAVMNSIVFYEPVTRAYIRYTLCTCI